MTTVTRFYDLDEIGNDNNGNPFTVENLARHAHAARQRAPTLGGQLRQLKTAMSQSKVPRMELDELSENSKSLDDVVWIEGLFDNYKYKAPTDTPALLVTKKINKIDELKQHPYGVTRNEEWEEWRIHVILEGKSEFELEVMNFQEFDEFPCVKTNLFSDLSGKPIPLNAKYYTGRLKELEEDAEISLSDKMDLSYEEGHEYYLDADYLGNYDWELTSKQLYSSIVVDLCDSDTIQKSSRLSAVQCDALVDELDFWAGCLKSKGELRILLGTVNETQPTWFTSTDCYKKLEEYAKDKYTSLNEYKQDAMKINGTTYNHVTMTKNSFKPRVLVVGSENINVGDTAALYACIPYRLELDFVYNIHDLKEDAEKTFDVVWDLSEEQTPLAASSDVKFKLHTNALYVYGKKAKDKSKDWATELGFLDLEGDCMMMIHKGAEEAVKARWKQVIKNPPNWRTELMKGAAAVAAAGTAYAIYQQSQREPVFPPVITRPTTGVPVEQIADYLMKGVAQGAYDIYQQSQDHLRTAATGVAQGVREAAESVPPIADHVITGAIDAAQYSLVTLVDPVKTMATNVKNSISSRYS